MDSEDIQEPVQMLVIFVIQTGILTKQVHDVAKVQIVFQV